MRNKIKLVISILIVIVFSIKSFSQTKKVDIPFFPAIQEHNSEDDLSKYFKTNLLNKLNQEISKNGCGASELSRFVVLVNPEVLNMTTNGQMMLYQFNLLFSFVDLVSKKTYNNFTIEIAGAGNTPGQAVYDATRRFNLSSSDFGANLKKACTQIVDYYSKNCNSIVAKANTLAFSGNVDEAVAQLYSIPDIQDLSCASKVNETLVNINNLITSSKCRNSIAEATKEWSLNPTEDGAKSVSSLLSNLILTDDCNQSYNVLIAEIKAKLTQKQFDAIQFRNKMYDDAINIQKQKMANDRDIAIEYYKNLIPPSYIYNYNDITNNTKKGNN